jgi:hypothetical protein
MSIEISILLVVAFAFGWYLGSKITTHLLALSFKQILEDLGVKNEQLRALAKNIDVEVPEPETPAEGLTPVEIILERHQGVIYAYRKTDSQFLGQGVDQQGLIDSISQRMDNVRLIIQESDGADLLQKNNT